MKTMKTLGMTLVLCAATSAFAQTTTTTTTTNAAPAPAMPLSTTDLRAQALSDEQIAKILLNLNQGEVDTSQVASKSAKSKEVRSFATMMVDHHKMNSKETNAWLKKNKMKATDSDLSRNLEKEKAQTLKDMKAAGQNVESVYMTKQIAMHEKALETLDGALIPNAKNPDLKAHLEKTRATVATHLDKAKGMEISNQ